MMEVEDVKQKVAEIQALAVRDEEEAHVAESELYQEVLRAIAAGAPNAQALAEEALKATLIDFSRWFA